MKCKQIQKLVGAYLYGDLTPDQMRDVRLHTAQCDKCRADVESRGRAVSVIPDGVPALSDEDRMQIAWAVKGAVRNGSARTWLGMRWGHVMAVGTVVLAGLAVGALVMMNSPKAEQPPMQADKNGSGVRVEIREERPQSAMKHTPEKTAPAIRPDGDSPALDTPRNNSIAEGVRRAVVLGTMSRHGENSKKVTVDKPAPVVEEPEKSEPAPAKDGATLPNPTDANDAQTTQEQGNR